MPNKESTQKIGLDISDLLAGLDAMKREISRANATFKSETAGMDSWSKNADGLSAKLKQLDSVLNSQNRILNNYHQQLTLANKKEKEAQEEVEKHKRELQKLVDDGIDKSTDAYKKKKAELDKAIKAQMSEASVVDDLKTKIDKQKAAIDTTKASIDKWTKAQENLEKESSSLENVVKNQERELKDLKKEYVNVAASEGESSDAAKDLGKKINQLSSDLVENKKKLSDAQKAADLLDESYDKAGDGALEAGEKAEQGGGLIRRSLDNFVGGMMVEAATRIWDGFKNAVKGTVSAMKDAAIQGAEYADDILTLASTTGIGTEALQEYKYMEDLVDVSTGTIAKSMKKLKSQISSAAKGNETATETFEKMGISIYDTNGELRDSEEIFNEAIDALAGIKNETERDAAAMDLFGRSATDLNPIIEAGSEKLEKLKQEAHDSGAVLSGSALEALGRAKDGMDRLSKSVEATKNSFSKNLAPAIEAATGSIADALNNPRTQRGLELISDGIGGVLSTLAEFATGGINLLLDALGLIDSRLELYTDEQLESIQATKEAKENIDYLHQSYVDSAEAIETERSRTEDLWNELQNLVDMDGKVLKGNEKRVDYILHELNDALGTEYERNGKIIDQYGEMRKQIGNLIAEQEVESLLAAREEEYAAALLDSGQEAKRAAELYADLNRVESELEEQTEKTTAAKEAFFASDEDLDSHYHPLFDAWQEELGTLNELQTQYDNLSADYQTSAANAEHYAQIIEQTEAAKEAAYTGEFETARRLLTEDLRAREEAHKATEKINEEDVKSLQEKLDKQAKAAADYKEKYKSGMKDYTKPVLDELEAQEKETRMILARITAGAKTWGEALGTNLGKGTETGLDSYTAKLVKTARAQMRSVLNGMKAEAQIASPSGVTEDYGEFLDLGLIKGMKNRLGALKAAAQETMAAVLPGQTAQDALSVSQQKAVSGGTTNNFTQNIYAPKTPSRLELYRDAQNLLQMAGGIR